jgi:hypothetical protein
MKRQAWAWDRIVTTYRSWRRGRYRRLIWGLIKRSLCLFLAVLKPIVKVPEIVLSFLALLEFVKLAKTIVVFRKVVRGIIQLILLFIGVEGGLV